MTPTKVGRGRPKGTGLNDAAQLRAIAGLLAADPALKPTTAIKTLGISDPSIIRRLRDKYHAEAESLHAELLGHSRPVADAVLVAASPIKAAAPRAAALAGPRDAKVSAIVHLTEGPIEAAASPNVVEKAPSGQTTRRPPSEPKTRTASPWLAQSASLFALSVEANISLFESMFHWPPVVAVIHTQAAFANLALALTSPYQFQSSRVA
jgi:hypothetical protein